MKKYFIIAVILGFGMLCRAQGSRDRFDSKKSTAELEIMKGILSTTISYAEQNGHEDMWNINTSGMSAYYLVGQGAVFVIPTSPFRSINLAPFLSGQNANLSLELSKMYQQTRLTALEAQRKAAELEKQAAELSKRGIASGLGSGVGPGTGNSNGNGAATATRPSPPAPPKPPSPPAPPTPPSPPAPPAPPQTNAAEIQKTDAEYQRAVAEYRQAIKKSQEKAAANQEKFLESLKEIRPPLIEALANYGDSLTQVKPEEYVNIVLQKDLFSADQGRGKESLDIISAKKSWITDYKAGRITLENFKQKVLQYTE